MTIEQIEQWLRDKAAKERKTAEFDRIRGHHATAAWIEGYVMGLTNAADLIAQSAAQNPSVSVDR